jgi:hypothetical protein
MFNTVNIAHTVHVAICSGNIPGMMLAMGGLAGNLVLQKLLETPITVDL